MECTKLLIPQSYELSRSSPSGTGMGQRVNLSTAVNRYLNPFENWHSDQVNINVLKAATRELEFSNRGNNMASDLRSLTCEAFSSPFCAVLAHGRPNNLFRDAETGFSFLSD